MKKSPVHTDQAPAAIGPYSQAIVAGGFVFCSGQVGIDPASGEIVGGGVEGEVRQVMKNLGGVLSAAGVGFADVVRTTIYLVDMGDFALVNRIYGEHVGPVPPARATVAVSALPKGAVVEIDAVALRNS